MYCPVYSTVITCCLLYTSPRKVLAPGFEAIKACVKEKMELFGSIGQA